MMKKIFIALKFAMIKISSGLLIQIMTMKILAVINTKGDVIMWEEAKACSIEENR